jgi:diketogulonate reductase-like aldo/keto reductase
VSRFTLFVGCLSAKLQSQAIYRSGLARDEVFIETKVRISDYG